MKTQPSLSSNPKCILLAFAVFLTNCTYNNRYTKQANITRIENSSTAILRKRDDKGGLTLQGKFGALVDKNKGGHFRDVRKYQEQEGKFGNKVDVLVERQFGQSGEYHLNSQDYFLEAEATLFTDSPLGIHFGSAGSVMDNHFFYLVTLGISLTFTSEFVGGGILIKRGIGNATGSVVYFNLDSAYKENESFPLNNEQIFDAAESKNTTLEIVGTLYYNRHTSFTPFVSGSFKIHGLSGNGIYFKEMTLFSNCYQFGGKYSVNQNFHLIGSSYFKVLNGFEKLLFGGELVFGYDFQF